MSTQVVSHRYPNKKLFPVFLINHSCFLVLTFLHFFIFSKAT